MKYSLSLLYVRITLEYAKEEGKLKRAFIVKALLRIKNSFARRVINPTT
jgi:hypothetical protein